MRRLAFAIVLLWAAADLAQAAPVYTGTWTAAVNGQTVSLTLAPDPQAPTTYQGQLALGGAQSAVLASVDADTGQLDGAVILQKAPDGKPTEFRDYLSFSAELNGPGLIFTLSMQDGPKQFEMRRAGAAPAPTPQGQPGLAGSYRLDQNGQVIELTLKPGADGQWTGTFTLGGQTTSLVGKLDPAKGVLQGAIQLEPTPAGAQPKEFQNYVFFVAEPTATGLNLTIKLQPGERQFALNRVGGGGAAPAPAPVPAGQVGELAGTYHMEQNGQVIDVTLTRGADGGYSGTFTLGGQTTALVGKLDPAKGVLQGVIQLNPTPAGAEAKEFENYIFFVAQPTAEGLLMSIKLQAGERQFPLQRRGAAPAPVNPTGPAGDPIGLEGIPPAGGNPAPKPAGGGLTGLFQKPTPEPPKPAGGGLGSLFNKPGEPKPPAYAGEYRHRADGQEATLVLRVDEKNKGQWVGTVSMGGQTLELAGKLGAKDRLEGAVQLRKTAAGATPKEHEDFMFFVAELTADGLTFTVKFADGEQPFAFKREATAGG